jgi:hypothetical protein
MWHLNVPKILHCYWGGNKLLYLRYLTIKTFIDLNPDWTVYLWCPIKSYLGKSWGIEPGNKEINYNLCNDYLPDLLKLSVKKIMIDFKELGFSDTAAEVHKADFIRINVLNLNGGVWTDLDILYFKPITKLLVNKLENKDKETFVCMTDYGHSTGFVMSVMGSKFYNKLSEVIYKEYKLREYQCLGPDMFNKYFKYFDSIPDAVNIEMDAVYAHNVYQVKELIETNKPRFTENSIGCHWYAGHSMWGKFFNETKGGVNNLPNNVIGNLIKNAK